ncbi:hypothetical protein BDF14DRAFT_334687 [Spinellus fusiger]|nr:hypothetical protein BDF14DRAFT_334687 [Spinellus fusiger]
MSTSRNDTNLSSVITKDEYYKTFDFYCQGITNVEEEQITHFSKALNCPRHLVENSNNERNGSSSQVDEIEKIEEKSGFREEILLTMRKSRNLQQNGHQETVEDSRNTELYQPIICKQYFNSLLMISVNAAKYSPQSPSLDLVLSEKNGIKPNQLKPFIQHLSNAKYTIQRIGMLSVIYVTENHAIIQEVPVLGCYSVTLVIRSNS